MKILIVTLADQPYWPIARISNPNKAAYAAKHGYDFRSYSHAIFNNTPTSWSKLGAILAHECYDWVFWTDADSLIINSEYRLESLIDPDYLIIAASDENGINYGQFLVQSTGLFILRDALLLSRVPHYRDHPWWEQSALHEIVKVQELEGKIKVVDQGKLNRLIPSGPEHNTLDLVMERVRAAYQPGDFILHFAGMGGERAHLREDAMAVMETEAK